MKLDIEGEWLCGKFVANVGAEYEVMRIKLPMRDKDKEYCDFCGNLLRSWNGAEMWEYKLIKRGTK